MAAKNNAAGGRGPCGGHVGGGGKREGMAGKTGPNHPGGRKPVDKVRQLQRRLWVAAKRHTGAVSTRCTTASRGVTSSRKRGSG